MSWSTELRICCSSNVKFCIYRLSLVSHRALDNGGLKALSLEKLLKVSQKGSRTFPVSDLLGRAMSHGQHDSNSLDGLKLILSNLEDLSISRALVEQYVDQLCNENIESLKGDENFQSLNKKWSNLDTSMHYQDKSKICASRIRYLKIPNSFQFFLLLLYILHILYTIHI